MEQHIEELKELVRHNIALSEETNAMVRRMRTAGRLGRFFKLIWVGVVIALLVAAYYYIAPYIGHILGLYNSAEQALEQAKQFGSQFGGQ